MALNSSWNAAGLHLERLEPLLLVILQLQEGLVLRLVETGKRFDNGSQWQGFHVGVSPHILLWHKCERSFTWGNEETESSLGLSY